MYKYTYFKYGYIYKILSYTFSDLYSLVNVVGIIKTLYPLMNTIKINFKMFEIEIQI